MGYVEINSDLARTSATMEACRQWVCDRVFRLRPMEYCKRYPDWPGMVGLELEMGVFYRESLGWSKPMAVPLRGDRSVSQALLPLAQKRGWQPLFQDDDPKSLLKLDLDQEDQVTFEPGGQVEISTKPYPCLSDALSRLTMVQEDLDAALQVIGARTVQYGINPWLTVQEIGLQMTKPRYQAMDQYFNRLSEYGRRMMRQTCTVQVNLDFGGDESTLAQRYLAANLMAPFTTAIFAYSPVVDGTVRAARSFRSQVWQGIDPSRTGFPDLETIARKLDRKSCVDAYLAAVLNARVVFVTGLGFQPQDGRVTFGDWLQRPIGGLSPSMADFETHLSLQFMEVRPRGFLELRPIDCQSRVWQAVPAAFNVGLLYDEKALAGVLDLLQPHLSRLPELWQKGSFGLKDPEIAAGAQRLMDLAQEGFGRLPECVRGQRTVETMAIFDHYFTRRGRCPADDIVDAITQHPGGSITPELWLATEDDWKRLVSQGGSL